MDGRELPLLFLAILLVPAITGNFSLTIFGLIFGIFAMGYHISLGETGMLTFGHAAFFGLGAYGCGMFLTHVDVPAGLGLLGIPVGVLLALVGGLFIGALSLRRRGTYLALITLAFGEMIYFIVFQWESLTGGDDGLYGMSTPGIGIPGVYVFQFEDMLGGLVTSRMLFFLFVFLIFVGALYAIRRLKRSNLGHVFNAIRENEDRASFLGYDVYRYRLLAFVISAGFSGLAGALYPTFLNFVGLDTLSWLLSGEVNFFILLGGIGTFVGPVVGSVSYYFITDYISAVTEHWELFVGLIFIGLVLYLPEGIIGTARDYLEKHTTYSTVTVPPKSDERYSGSEQRGTPETHPNTET
ncbi:branched-chain amino acid ABC transporter permease [Haloarchaeobius sp. HRN-SO-5]|uniref:branched-chain amino acid ABC transporter permease n=1 Tax=Haloarchaeobius sp. HRN-SO-5 TaxID=3446118 RepID=UPI003EBA8C81